MSATNVYQPDLDRAREMTERGAQTFTDADLSAYMNPYIQGALEPAARELRRETERNVRDVRGQAAQAGAFGGSRAALLETETARGGTEALSDLYARGYQSAFEDAATRFALDRDAAARSAEQFRALGSQRQAQYLQDINALLTTGGLRRSLAQAGLDFDYGQFIEARDWDITNLQPLLAALSSVPYGETQTTSDKSGGIGQIIGLATAALGAFGGVGGGGAAASAGPISIPGPGQKGYVPTFGESTLQQSQNPGWYGGVPVANAFTPALG
jgi:hypothetical protein